MHPATPCTPPPQSHSQVVHTLSTEDFDILDQITAPDFLRSTADARFRRRDNDFDPLIIATAITGSDPAVTRHHYLHGDIGIFSSSDGTAKPRGPAQSQYVSQQKPRHQRLKEELAAAGAADASSVIRGPIPALSTQEIQTSLENPSSPTVSPKNQRPSLLLRPSSPKPLQATVKSIEPAHLEQAPATLVADSSSSSSSKPQHVFSAALSVSKPVSRDRRPPLVVQCRARTRVPTPHGPVFLHLYHNNWDSKEHLAVVIDPAQLDDVSEDGTGTVAPPIRSRSLDAQYEGETEMDRITRGAYVGRLSSTRSFTSKPVIPITRSSEDPSSPTTPSYPAPLIRIHSECFTGETIGSMRCDCGEQLDEAMRLIAQPQTLSGSQKTIPGRGAVVYLRQEGRGIGLLEKIKAYNLQDLGHDTVTANLMLGHGADERGYEIAAAILRDLGLGGEEEGVRVLTNNPEKMGALQAEGVK
ncbi:GTP cyclohydrolase II, partial [Tulasnella sp. 417]